MPLKLIYVAVVAWAGQKCDIFGRSRDKLETILNKTPTQSLCMILGERDRRLDSIEAGGVPQWNPIFSPFAPESYIATGYKSDFK